MQLLTSQIKETYDRYQPRLCNIYNMDESFFQLSLTRKTRTVASRHHPLMSQARPAANQHITVIATISADGAAPIPPFIIYPGPKLMDSWFEARDPEPLQLAAATESGWTNNHMGMQWLELAFDPFSKPIARDGQDVRLLFLDGHDSHVNIAFLEACIGRNIIVIIFPANMTGILQPLDVSFFNQLKAAYHEQQTTYLLGNSLSPVAKGAFWRWHQRAWAATATSRTIRGAWRKAGLVPLELTVLGALLPREITPPPMPNTPSGPPTPTSLRILRSNKSAIRTGRFSEGEVLQKTEKALENALAKGVLMERELNAMREAQKLDKETRALGRKSTCTNGETFDPRYMEEHRVKVAAQKEREAEAKRVKIGKARAAGKLRVQDLGGSPTAGPSTLS